MANGKVCYSIGTAGAAVVDSFTVFLQTCVIHMQIANCSTRAVQQCFLHGTRFRHPAVLCFPIFILKIKIKPPKNVDNSQKP